MGAGAHLELVMEGARLLQQHGGAGPQHLPQLLRREKAALPQQPHRRLQPLPGHVEELWAAAHGPLQAACGQQGQRAAGQRHSPGVPPAPSLAALPPSSPKRRSSLARSRSRSVGSRRSAGLRSSSARAASALSPSSSSCAAAASRCSGPSPGCSARSRRACSWLKPIARSAAASPQPRRGHGPGEAGKAGPASSARPAPLSTARPARPAMAAGSGRDPAPERPRSRPGQRRGSTGGAG